MAKTQVVTYKFTDDLTGEEIPEDEASTIEFSYGGTDYTIDLSAKNAKKLDDFLAPYVDAATKVRKSGGSAKKSSGKSEEFPKYDRAELTKWAKENGYEVSERGRISYEVLRAYFHKN